MGHEYFLALQSQFAPPQIERARKYHAAVSAGILTLDASADEDFAMTVGNRVYTGKGAREDAGNALAAVVLSWHDDLTVKVRGSFRGFEILSRGSDQKDREPDLFVRGREAYKANLNLENPMGTISSIEHTLRGLDRRAEEEHDEIQRQEKTLADYRAQLGRPFEHESRLRDLLSKQAQLNACLDLDKHEAQIVDEPRESGEETASSAARRPTRTSGGQAVPPPAVCLGRQPGPPETMASVAKSGRPILPPGHASPTGLPGSVAEVAHSPDGRRFARSQNDASPNPVCVELESGRFR